MDQQPQQKWEWTISTPFKQATSDQIWPLLKDFFNIHKWFPGLPTCYGVHGTNGEVGCIRYCAGFSIPSVDGSTGWSTERLTAIDPAERMIRGEPEEWWHRTVTMLYDLCWEKVRDWGCFRELFEQRFYNFAFIEARREHLLELH